MQVRCQLPQNSFILLAKSDSGELCCPVTVFIFWHNTPATAKSIELEMSDKKIVSSIDFNIFLAGVSAHTGICVCVCV